MGIDRITALSHLDVVLIGFRTYQEGIEANFHSRDSTANDKIAELVVRLTAALRRLSPPGSIYLEVFNEREKIDSNWTDPEWHYCCRLAGSAQALREDYAGDCLTSFRELINADLYSDFLSMAEFLIQDERLIQPAAVLAGGVLEEHVRKLCIKHGIDCTFIDGKGDVQPKKVDTMNADLKKAGVYTGNDQKQITAWCGIRNSAAHAKHGEYNEDQVSMFIFGLRTFISRFPA